MTIVNNQPATKKDIDNLYLKIKGEFTTKEDLKRFATKEDLKNELEKYATKEDLKELKNEFSEMKNDILEMKDEILGELSDIRENQEVHNYSHSRINDDLFDHETRIKKLEKVSPAV